MNHLLAAYPLTLSGWDAREAYSFTPSARRGRLGLVRDQLEIVSLMLRVGAVYLDLACFPASEIIGSYTLVPLRHQICQIAPPTATLLPPLSHLSQLKIAQQSTSPSYKQHP
jgi:hypothetical protein